MLTPQEVSERAFQKATFNGYNMSQVDEFLDILTADYSALYSENAVLKSKMKVLADKVEEYRATEDAMRQAFMIAQRRADDLVREAEQKRAALIHEAEGEARQRMESITKEVEAEEFRLQQAKNATAAFVDKLRAIHAKQEEFLDQLGEMCPDAQPQPAPDPVEETVSEIDDNVQRLLNQAMLEATPARRRGRSLRIWRIPPSLAPCRAARRRTKMRRICPQSGAAALTSVSSSSAETMRSNEESRTCPV